VNKTRLQEPISVSNFPNPLSRQNCCDFETQKKRNRNNYRTAFFGLNSAKRKSEAQRGWRKTEVSNSKEKDDKLQLQYK